MQQAWHGTGRAAAALALIADIFRHQAGRDGARASALRRLAAELDHLAAALIVPARPPRMALVRADGPRTARLRGVTL